MSLGFVNDWLVLAIQLARRGLVCLFHDCQRFLPAKRYTQKEITASTATSAAVIHSGDVTHHHDHEMRPVSLRMRNTMNTMPGRDRPVAGEEFDLPIISLFVISR